MRGKLIISAVVLALVGAAGPALANFFYPGRVIIGYGGGTFIGTTTNAMVGPGPGCVLEHEIECECFAGATVLQACEQSGVDTACLTPEMQVSKVIQKEPVVFDLGMSQLGSLVCSGKSDGTANIILPKPEG